MPMKHEPMKRIALNYRKKWSPRTTIVVTVVDAVVTGVFLGATLFEYLRGRDVFSWIFLLVMAFASSVGTLRGTLIALRNCPRPTEASQNESAPRGARA